MSEKQRNLKVCCFCCGINILMTNVIHKSWIALWAKVQYGNHSLPELYLKETTHTLENYFVCLIHVSPFDYAFNQNRCTCRCSNNVPKNVNTFCPCVWYYQEQCHLMHKQAQLFPIEMKVQSANIIMQISRKRKDVYPYFLFKNNYCL